MNRLYVVVEGDTELAFVKRTLAPHLHAKEIWTAGIEVTTKYDRRTRAKRHRGGGHWKHWHSDILKLTKSQPGGEVRFTSLFDLYGLPNDFPGLGQHRSQQDTRIRAERLEEAMAAAVDDYRFIPYLQRHEFEALVLAALDRLPDFLQDEEDRAGVEKLRGTLGALAPEDVNDGKTTAPSKRLLSHLPSYQKATHGPLVTQAAGLPGLRAKCPRFNAWVTKLEGIGSMEP